jgi:hypothetical protein
MKARLVSRKLRNVKSSKATRIRKGEPAWVKALRKANAPPEIIESALNRARRMGIGAQRGRPAVEIDEDSLAALGRQGCTNEGIADILGIARSTLQEKLSTNASLAECLTHARAMRHRDLRVAQTSVALGGNPRMLEFLGIQELGQRKKLQLSGEPGQPPVALSITDVVAVSAARRREREQREDEGAADVAETGADSA